MGSIAEELSDQLFITSDNPRSEEPQKIVNDILMGIKKRENITIEIDRFQAITILYKLNFSLKDLSKLIQSFPGAPGRMEKIQIDNDVVLRSLPTVIVDYAHTPDGLKKVLQSIKKLC